MLQLIDTLEKIQSTSQQIALQLRRDCQCTIDTPYITAAQLSCDPLATGHVIYRARLSSTRDADDAALVQLLQDWVTSGTASITLEHIRLGVDASCGVVISSFQDPVCPLPVTTSDSTPTDISVENMSSMTLTVALIAAVLAVILIVAIVIIAVFCVWMKSQRKSAYDLR